MRKLKYKMLAKGLVLDAAGMVTMVLPGIGTVIDLVWAPIAAWQMNKMYPGKQGKMASVIVFLEELIPGLDFIPTFTLMWLYTYVFNSEDPGELTPIKVRANR
ncbi:hypothetical protein [Gilvibacter sediminis]|uniref:hypothetical protein n=1 Tax=Gilvibacter sediminis TaxID=379071 RepID=UPI002350DF0D|nr:hypothetical protein [Gilvibacter sediminis]MDC7998237.1 hypothetical protein [Gilvibacter sediminis]